MIRDEMASPVLDQGGPVACQKAGDDETLAICSACPIHEGAATEDQLDAFGCRAIMRYREWASELAPA